MKRRMLEKTRNIVLMLVFVVVSLLSAVPDVAFAASDFVLTQTCTNTPLTQGSTFRISINLRNVTADPIDNIQLDFSSAGIAVLTNGGTIVTSPVTVNGGADLNIGSYDLRFIGDGSTGLMPVKVSYELNNVLQPVATVNLYLDAQETSTPEPVDPDLYKPTLTATVPDNTSVFAGTDTGIKLTIKNASASNMARNITFSSTIDENFNQTKILTEMPIKELYANQSKEVTLSINPNKFIKDGIYPYKFKLNYMGAMSKEYTTDYTVYIKVQNLNSATRLTVTTAPTDNVQAYAGKSFSVPVYLVNSGSFYAKDVSVTLSGLSQEAFTLASGATKLTFDKVDAKGNVKFNLSLTAAAGMKSGSYPLSFKVDYMTEKGDPVSETQELWIPVSGSGDQVSQVEVLEIKPTKTTVTESDLFDVTVKVKNSGNVKLDQLKVSADGTAALLPVSQNLFIVSTLQPGETKTLTFKFQVSPDAARGSVPIIVKVDNLTGGNTSISQAVSVFVDATDDKTEAGKNVPKIIVQSYSADPALVKAGEQFKLKMTFMNTHAGKSIRNIKGSFIVNEGSDKTGNVFTPVNCSNTFYIDGINAKGTYDWDLTLYTIPDAKSKTYMVTISFEYEDEEGNPYKAEEIVGIPVYQPSRFETSEINLPPEAMMGQPIYLAFEMYNMGKTDIYNVRMSVEGDFDAQPKSSYFGNFESGRSEYCEINLMPMMTGTAKGKLVVTYESASGDIQTYEKEFSMNVMDMPMDPGFPVDGGGKPGFPMEPGMGEGMEQPATGGFIGSVWFFVIIGAVVLVVVIVIIIVKKRKKSKEFEF